MTVDLAAPPWLGDLYARALHSGRGPLYLRRDDGWALPLDVERWCAPPDAADRAVLARCVPPVVDLGCGPGRFCVALTAAGVDALGVDVSAAAVARVLASGGEALHASVFAPLPGAGDWSTALLMDGNLGIGGDPAALLDRVADLVRPGGALIVETVPGEVDERVLVRVDDGVSAPGPEFPWARLGTRALLRVAADGPWTPTEEWREGRRCFVALRR